MTQQTTQHRAGVAPGWERVTDANGTAQYLPVPSKVRRRPAVVEVLPPIHQDAKPPVQTVQAVTTSHVDRARGFTMTTVPLAAVVGVVAVLAAVGLAGVPWMSWSALLVLFGVFALVWAGAYFWHVLASPDGATVLSILLSYRYVRHEQRARLDRLAQWESDDDGD